MNYNHFQVNCNEAEIAGTLASCTEIQDSYDQIEITFVSYR